MTHSGPPVEGSPTISVVIPTCDRPEFAEQAIASALAQTLPPSQVILVDNGYNPFAGPRDRHRLSVLRLPPRCGASRARNAGARAAKGEYLAFLDDDDWWSPSFLEELHRTLIRDGTRCGYGRKDRWRDGRLRHYKTPGPEDMTVENLLRRNPGTGGMNLLVERRLFIEIGGFDEELPASEDRAFALEVLLAGEEIACAPKAVSVARHHDGERLRQDPRRRLAFVWKYRRHLPRTEWVGRALELYAQWAFGICRTIWSRRPA